MYWGISLCRGEYIRELPSGVVNALVDYFLLQWGMTLSLQWGMTLSLLWGMTLSLQWGMTLSLQWGMTPLSLQWGMAVSAVGYDSTVSAVGYDSTVSAMGYVCLCYGWKYCIGKILSAALSAPESNCFLQ